MTLTERFWSKVQVGAADACWPWTGARSSPGGYGNLGAGPGGTTLKAHRVSWELANGGPVPAGMTICHRCDTPCCVNPAHLFVGTPSENTQDCIAKGRFVTLHGEQRVNSRLTADQARQIYSLRGTQSIKSLAERFNIDRSIVSRILSGSRWVVATQDLREAEAERVAS